MIQYMKAVGIALAIALLFAGNAGAATEDDQAAVAAIIPGRIINRPWGWVISAPRGDTHVIRERDGYTVTTPHATFHLIRTSDGFAVSPGAKGARVLSPDQAIDLRERARRRR